MAITSRSAARRGQTIRRDSERLDRRMHFRVVGPLSM